MNDICIEPSGNVEMTDVVIVDDCTILGKIFKIRGNLTVYQNATLTLKENEQ